MKEQREEAIIRAIEDLNSNINKRFDDIDRRLRESEETQFKLDKTQQAQEAQINELFEKVDKLCAEKTIWRRNKEVAVRREDAYALFDELGLTNKQALNLLDSQNRLAKDRDGIHYAKPVRAPGIGRVRAIVIRL